MQVQIYDTVTPIAKNKVSKYEQKHLCERISYFFCILLGLMFFAPALMEECDLWAFSHVRLNRQGDWLFSLKKKRCGLHNVKC